MTEPEIQYWDSALFINLVTGKVPEYVAAITHLWEMASQGKSRIVLSYFVLTEVRPKPEFMEAYTRISREFLEADWPFIRWYAVTHDIATDARALCADFPRLCNPDAIHLATARKARADVFFTYDGLGEDKRLRRTKGLLAMNGRIDGLRIEPPDVHYGSPQASLFDLIASGLPETPAVSTAPVGSG